MAVFYFFGFYIFRLSMLLGNGLSSSFFSFKGRPITRATTQPFIQNPCTRVLTQAFRKPLQGHLFFICLAPAGLVYFSHKEAIHETLPLGENLKSINNGAVPMSTSLKPVLGRQLRGMRHLESKISDLQTQYQSLLKERQQDITTIIATLDLASLEDPLIIGALLFIKEKVTAKDSIVEAWRDAGEKFLRQTKSNSRPREGEKQMGNFSRPREHEDGKQERVCSRIPPEKSPSSKQTAPPQATAQPPQKQPQSREA